MDLNFHIKLTFDDKLEIIRYKEANKTVKSTRIAEIFLQNKKKTDRTIKNIIDEEDNIIKLVTEGYGKKFTKPVFKLDVIDKDLSLWMEHSRVEKNMVFTDDIIMKKAQKIAEEKDVKGRDYLPVGQKFKKGNNLSLKMIVGEGKQVNVDSGEIQNFLTLVTRKN